MPYTVEEGGRLNAYAKEPDMYVAEPPSKSEQRNYLAFGVGSVALIGGLIWLASLASSSVS